MFPTHWFHMTLKNTSRAVLLSTALIMASPALAQDGEGSVSDSEAAGEMAGEQPQPQPQAYSLPADFDQSLLGKRDAATLAVQVMLDRSSHSPGIIDGLMGGNTRRAIAAFRRTHDLPAGTGIDDALLTALAGTQSATVLKRYEITQEDAGGPFTDVPSDFAAQAELDHVGYESAHEMLAERFHMDQAFLSAINPGTSFSQAGSEIWIVESGDDKLPGDIARIEVRKGDGAVVALDADGKELASFPATIGSGEFPSPSGRMEVSAIAPEANYTFNPDAQNWGPDKTFVIPPGPNNPVGGVWIDLGKNGYGIHGSPDPQLIGKTASHGCVRLTNWDAKALAAAVSAGVEVEFV